MKAFQLHPRPEASSHYGILIGVDKCDACSRILRNGQWVVVFHVFDDGLIRRGIYTHADCVRNALDTVPDTRNDTFTALKQKIHASGQAFPE